MKTQDKPEIKNQKYRSDEPAYRRKLLEMVANIFPEPPIREPARQSSPESFWKAFGRMYIPGLLFPAPYNSIINLILYSLASVLLTLGMVRNPPYSTQPIEKVIIAIVMFSVGSFILLSFGNFFIIQIWSQIRNPVARKRVLYFTLPYFLLFIAMYVHDTWTSDIWQSLITTLKFIPCLGLLTLVFGALLGFSSETLPPLSKKATFVLLGLSLLGSIGLVFGASYQTYVVVLKNPAAEYFTTITLGNVIMFSIGVLMIGPLAFRALWELYRKWLVQKQGLIEYFQRYRRIFDAVVEFVKGINFNRSYYLYWIFLAIPFAIALIHNIYYHYIPWLELSQGKPSEGLSMIVKIAISINLVLLISSGFLLGLITFEYIFIPEAIKSIKAQIPRFISRPVYKAVVVLLMLFTAWLFLHALMVYTIQFWPLLEKGSGEGYIDLLETFFYVFSNMTGYDLTDYKPVDLPVRLYTIPIVLTGIILLIIFLGTAFSSQDIGKPDGELGKIHRRRHFFYTSMRSKKRG